MSEVSPIYFDSHMHTPLCKHALGEPEEYAEVALERGLRGIVFTCHCPMPDQFWPRVRMAPEEFDDYVALIERAADAFEGALEVRLGIESEYFPGYESWCEDLHGRADFHHVLGSVHYFSPEYGARYGTGDELAFKKQYFDHLAESAETGLYDTLSHPDLVKNYSAETWDFEEMRESIAGALDRIAAAGVAMECNTSGVNKRIPEPNPGPQMLEMMCQRDIPVVIGSDSHTPRRVGENFEMILDLLVDAGYESAAYFERRERRDIPIEDIRASLRDPVLSGK